MKKSKKIFLGFAILFFGMLAYLTYDISSKTTHPAFKKKTNDEMIKSDTIKVNGAKEK